MWVSDWILDMNGVVDEQGTTLSDILDLQQDGLIMTLLLHPKILGQNLQLERESVWCVEEGGLA